MNSLRLDGRSLSRLVVTAKARLAAVGAWNLAITSSLARMFDQRQPQNDLLRTRFSGLPSVDGKTGTASDLAHELR